MAPLIATKLTKKEIATVIATAIGAFINWWFTGKSLDLQRTKTGQVVCNLQDRLSKVVIEVLRAK